MIPAGSSLGAITVRARVSESSRRIAPKIMLKGMRVRLFGPVIFRTIWGAIKPTKPIVPPAQTEALTAKAPQINTRIRSLSTCTPRELAVFSPQVSRSRGCEITNIMMIEIRAAGEIKRSSFQPRPLKLPKIQV